MTYVNADALVSTEWLSNHMKAPDVRVVDASWFLPSSGRNPREEYDAEHIPGAVFFDISEISDPTSPLPHMLPAPEKFSSRVRKLGLGNGNRIVIYDSSGFTGAATRVWWMFRYFGHTEVSVLDGGLPKWRLEGRPLEDLPPMPRDRHFIPRVNSTLVRSCEQIKNALETGRETIVDVRSVERFKGAGAEPWPVKRTGHMPGALNLPFGKLVNETERTMKSVEDLKKIIAEAGIRMDRPVAVTCGSGITACTLALALHLLGHESVAVYDGSWAEWGNREDVPVESA